MRKIKKIGVWPVGLVGGLNAESPEVDSKTGIFFIIFLIIVFINRHLVSHLKC